jgi:uncharacterized protein (DUF1330 family)
MPKAYLVAQVNVHDAQGYEAYRSRTGAVIETFGGRFLVRGGVLHPLEGELEYGRLAIIEFPDLESAQAFYDSPAYQDLLPHRTQNSDAILFFAEGVSP